VLAIVGLHGLLVRLLVGFSSFAKKISGRYIGFPEWDADCGVLLGLKLVGPLHFNPPPAHDGLFHSLSSFSSHRRRRRLALTSRFLLRRSKNSIGVRILLQR
jgi:hypothetical protein